MDLTIPDAVSKLVPTGYFGDLPVYNSSQLKRRGFFMLIVARGGGGKTTLAGSLADNPNIRPIFLFDIDRTSFVLGHRQDIDIGYIYDWPQMQNAAVHLQETEHPFKGIIVDNISVLADMNFKYNTAKIHSADPRQHYAAMTSDMLAFISFFRDYSSTTGVTVIMTAWEGFVEHPITGLLRSTALFNPALQQRFEGLFPTIGYLDVDDDGVHTLHFGPNKRRATKLARSQEGVELTIPLTIKNPNLGKIAKTLIEGLPYEIESEENESAKD